jgi:C-terminal peptidase prc
MEYLRRASMFLLIALALGGCSITPPEAALPTAVPAASATPARPATPAAAPSAPPGRTPAPTGRPPSPTPAAANTPRPTVELIAPTPTLAPLTMAERERIFQQIWETVRDHYLYSDYRGVDWQAARAEFAPKVAAASSPEAFYNLMRELIDRLGDDHSRFESPQDVAAQEAEFAGNLRYGGIGAEIRDVDEGGLVSSVVPGGPADTAGIMPRDIVIAIDGIAFTDAEAFGADGQIGRVRGEPGTRVQLTVRRKGQPDREVAVTRAAIDMDAFNRVAAQRLPGGRIGLVTIPSFYVEAVDTHVREAVESLLAAGPLDGLLIDVRNNSGGYVYLMLDTIALFHNGGSIGSTSGRSASEEQRVPAGKTIAGLDGVPIVVLSGTETVSAGEMFAAGMQVLGRAQVVGVPSAGNTENLYSYNFDDGSQLLLAEVAYKLPDGTLIEGRGVIPDRQVDAEWWRYAPADDPQVIAAIDQIRSQQR